MENNTNQTSEKVISKNNGKGKGGKWRIVIFILLIISIGIWQGKIRMEHHQKNAVARGLLKEFIRFDGTLGSGISYIEYGRQLGELAGDYAVVEQEVLGKEWIDYVADEQEKPLMERDESDYKRAISSLHLALSCYQKALDYWDADINHKRIYISEKNWSLLEEYAPEKASLYAPEIGAYSNEIRCYLAIPLEEARQNEWSDASEAIELASIFLHMSQRNISEFEKEAFK